MIKEEDLHRYYLPVTNLTENEVAELVAEFLPKFINAYKGSIVDVNEKLVKHRINWATLCTQKMNCSVSVRDIMEIICRYIDELTVLI